MAPCGVRFLVSVAVWLRAVSASLWSVCFVLYYLCLTLFFVFGMLPIIQYVLYNHCFVCTFTCDFMLCCDVSTILSWRVDFPLWQ